MFRLAGGQRCALPLVCIDMTDSCEFSRDCGLTVLELLVALAIMALVAGLGIPALQDAAHNARRLAAVNAVTRAIWYARSTATHSGTTVVLCKSDEQRQCSAAAGGRHWIIAGQLAGGSPARQQTLRVFTTGFSGVISSNRSMFEFRPLPQRSSNGTIRFCDPRGGRHERAIIVSYSGRPRLARPQTDAGFPECDAEQP
jgi:type IV fimbrial biogenesis protein FimT